MKIMKCKYLIIGGGIAGVSCAEKICEISPSDSVILVSMTHVIKRVANLRHLSKIITSFDVIEEEASSLEASLPNLRVLTHTQIIDMDPISKTARSDKGLSIMYDKACLCLGARPNMPFKDVTDPKALEHILTIRDVESVSHLQSRLSSSRRIAVIGNGGIAGELVFSLQNIDVLWAIKDKHLLSVFCDEVSGEFLFNALNSEKTGSQRKEDDITSVKRLKYSVESSPKGEASGGAALGPDWHNRISVQGRNACGKSLHIEKSTQIQRITSTPPEESTTLFGAAEEESSEKWNVYLEFDNGKVYGVDFIVSATGVLPNGDLLDIGLELTNGAINVNENMVTNLPHIYAAGDCCCPKWDSASPEWFQMRLWTQARQMGAFAGIRMTNNDEDEMNYLDFCFELFSHATTFFGYKVILLGLYNAQNLNESDYEVELRITEGKEFVKIIKVGGRLKGAILIGETDLEETFENLILNQLNVEGIDLLDPIVDIDDYFD